MMNQVAAMNAYQPGTIPSNYDGPADHTDLRENVFEQVLERFGFSSQPDPTRETLDVVVKQWSRQVGYDNVLKRIYIAERQTGAFPSQDPNDFFNAWLAHGVAAGCWPSAEAMYGILFLIGFRVSRLAGTMPEVPDPMMPAHGGLNVYIDGRTFRADPSLGAEAALELIEGERTAQPSPAHGLWCEGDGVVRWYPGHMRNPLSTVFWLEDLSPAFYAYRNEATKAFSIFNHSLYVRKNRDDGVLTFGRGNLITVDPEGELTARPTAPEDVPGILIERFGLSEEIAARVPVQDDEGAKFE
jgi:arylamine N-acetyltransferase